MKRSGKSRKIDKLEQSVRNNPNLQTRHPNSLEWTTHTLGSYIAENDLEMPRKLKEILSAKRNFGLNSKKSADSKHKPLAKFRQADGCASKHKDKKVEIPSLALSTSDKIARRVRNPDLALIHQDYQEKINSLYRHSTRTWIKRKR